MVLVSACNLVFGLDPLTYDPAQRIIAFVDASEAEVPADGALDGAFDGASDAGDGGDAGDGADANPDASSSDAGDGGLMDGPDGS